MRDSRDTIYVDKFMSQSKKNIKVQSGSRSAGMISGDNNNADDNGNCRKKAAATLFLYAVQVSGVNAERAKIR